MVAIACRGVEGWKSSRRSACWVDTSLKGPQLGKARNVAVEEEGRELRRSAMEEEGMKKDNQGSELKYSGALSGGGMLKVVSTRVRASGELGASRSDSSLRSEGE